jgi:hypothetical protein
VMDVSIMSSMLVGLSRCCDLGTFFPNYHFSIENRNDVTT